jgi:hypothetical protein
VNRQRDLPILVIIGGALAGVVLMFLLLGSGYDRPNQGARVQGIGSQRAPAETTGGAPAQR